MTARVFIDGEVGTTGLQIRARLAGRDDLEFLSLPEDRRKDAGARAELLNTADIAILCLPDDAAREAVSMIDNSNTRIIDPSTAHRISDGWVYGFPEYEQDQAGKIASARRVTNPGCYAITAISMLHPLISSNVIPADLPITINAVSGYSGGGRQLIASFEDESTDTYTTTPYFAYGLGLDHKHNPEINHWGGTTHPVLFTPSVGRYRQGMLVQIPLQLWALENAPSAAEIHAALASHYAGCRFVTVPPIAETAEMTKLNPEGLNGTNELRIHVFANEKTKQAVIVGLIDNLGKGASGQTVQNLNLMLGVAEGTGLEAGDVLPV